MGKWHFFTYIILNQVVLFKCIIIIATLGQGFTDLFNTDDIVSSATAASECIAKLEFNGW